MATSLKIAEIAFIAEFFFLKLYAVSRLVFGIFTRLISYASCFVNVCAGYKILLVNSSME